MSWLESVISDICSVGVDDALAPTLSLTLEDFSSVTNSAIVNIMRNSVYAVGASLLTCFMLIELVAMVNRSGSTEAGLSSMKLPANILIKFGIFAFLFCHIPAILGAIQDIGSSIATSMISYSLEANVGVNSSQVIQIADAIEDLGFFQKIFTYLTVLLAWIIIMVIKAILNITVMFRLFEMWLFLLFSPIPLSTFASTEMRQTSLNFIKSFMALSLQGAAILGCCLIYSSLQSHNFIVLYDGSVDVGDYIVTILFTNIIFALALAVSVFSSGRIIKQICNAM